MSLSNWYIKGDDMNLSNRYIKGNDMSLSNWYIKGNDMSLNMYPLGQKKNMCVYGHTTEPIFQRPTLTFFIGNYSTLILASDPINFYTEFG